MIEDINELLDKDPFEEFIIVTSSGEKYRIKSPHNVTRGASKIGYFTPKSDKWVVIRMNQITALRTPTSRKAR